MLVYGCNLDMKLFALKAGFLLVERIEQISSPIVHCP
jgi:hypothetical protein